MTTVHSPERPTFFARLWELLSDSAVYGLSTLVTQIVGFLLLPLYTRLLTPADYGVLAMLNVVTMTFTPLSSMCLPSAAYRRLNLQQDDDSAKGMILTTLACGVAAVCVVWLIVGMMGAGWIAEFVVGDVSATSLVRWTMLTAVFTILGEVARIDLRNRRRTRTVALLNVASFAVTVALTVWFVVVVRAGVSGVVWGGLGGAAFAAASAAVLVRDRFRLSFDRTELRSMFSYGVPLIPHRLIALGIFAYSQFYVREQLGLDQAGLLDMAIKFALPLGLVINAVQEAWIPYKFQVHATDERPETFFRESFTYYLALVLFLWVAISAWGPEALRLMTDGRFHAAASLVALAALMRVTWGIYMMLGSGIELSSDTRPYSLISLTGLIVVVTTTIWTVRWWGAFGAAASTSFAYLAMAAMARRLARTRFQIPYDWPRIAALSAMASGCVAITYMFAGVSFVPRLTIAIAVSSTFPVAAWVIVGGRRRDAMTWRQSVQAEISS